MKRLYATTDPTEAELLRALLRDAGIDVADQDAPAAAELLAAHFEKQDAGEAGPKPAGPLEDAPRQGGWLARLMDRLAGKKRGSAPR